MSNKRKLAVGIIGLVIFICAAALLYGNLKESAPITEADASAEPSAERLKAPDFTVEDSEGNSVKLSDMEGKPVVLNFWASWCPPCKMEMPEFEAAWAEYGGEVAFMMVDLVDGQQETKESGARYVSEQGFTFPVYFDTSQEAAYGYGVTSIPMTLFIDGEGYIVTGARGMIDGEALRRGIAMITGE